MHRMYDRIVLIGPRGSGKSTVGQKLAAHLGWSCVDLDDRVLGAFDAATVTDVWQQHGEAAWRAAETCELQRALAETQAVIATGGGVPMIESCRELLLQEKADRLSACVYLQCSVELLMRRLLNEPGDRPPLGDHPDLYAEIERVLADREPTYVTLADVIVQMAGDEHAVGAARKPEKVQIVSAADADSAAESIAALLIAQP